MWVNFKARNVKNCFNISESDWRYITVNHSEANMNRMSSWEEKGL